jgi:hypothetical protein
MKIVEAVISNNDTSPSQSRTKHGRQDGDKALPVPNSLDTTSSHLPYLVRTSAEARSHYRPLDKPIRPGHHTSVSFALLSSYAMLTDGSVGTKRFGQHILRRASHGNVYA